MSEGVRRCAEGSGSDADGSGFDVLRDRLVVIEERSERKKNADPNVVYAILCLSPNNCSHFISQPKWCGSYTQVLTIHKVSLGHSKWEDPAGRWCLKPRFPMFQAWSSSTFQGGERACAFRTLPGCKHDLFKQ
ncbi:hypothetical protein JHK87_032005 [Glycine soja]|nr:hypothetical protein JHK87_032005 [Glycine soja]